MKKKSNKFFGGLFLLIFIFSIACGRVSFSPENTKTDSAKSLPTPQLTEIEREIKAMENADFSFIFVFKRKDGGEFDKADRNFLRENRTPEINRFVATEDKKAFIVGSNYEFLPEHWKNLQKHFVVEDYSKPKEQGK